MALLLDRCTPAFFSVNYGQDSYDFAAGLGDHLDCAQRRTAGRHDILNNHDTHPLAEAALYLLTSAVTFWFFAYRESI
jgi:hypothetical protein